MNENIINANANGLCKCCLGETNLQNICEQQDGNDENYAEILKNCFGILLTPSDSPELICENCVTRLKDAMAFKQEILTTQRILQEGPSELRSMTRNELYTILTRSNEATFDEKLQFMEVELLKNFADNDQVLSDAKQKISLIKHQFKQKWLAANKIKARFEKNNADWLNGIIFLPIPSAGKIFVKVEEEEDVEDSASQEDYFEYVEYLDDDDEYKPEDVPSSSQASTPERGKQKYPKKLPKKCRNKTYKQYTMSDLREAVQSVLCGDLQCADAAKMYGIPRATLKNKLNEAATETKDDDAKGSSEKHYQLIEDIKKILEYTNAIPFRTKANRYYCFYCPADGPFYEDADELRSHTESEHGQEKIIRIEHIMKPAWVNEVLKLDVHNLQCTECCTLLPDWNNMFVHFAETHSIGFDEGYTKIIPYSLTSDLVCVLCHQGFHNFGQLDAHMNQHYSNYICYQCGDTFLAANRLDKHLTVHKVGSYPCSLCDKEFTLERYRAKHCSLVHRQERKVKCLYCDEKFVDLFHRHRHVTEAHKEKVKTMTCEVCGKVFTWKAYFLAHMRKRHRGEKKHKCQFCSKAFLMQHELKNHLVKHTGEKNFVCLCGESFKWANILRKHVREVHDDADTIVYI